MTPALMVDLTSSRQRTGQQKHSQPVLAQVSQATAGDEKQTDAGTDAFLEVLTVRP